MNRIKEARFRIYRNLHDNTWTIQHYVKGKGWRKLESRERVAAPRCTFKVYESGALRARDEGRKNVHAFAIVPYITNAIVDPCDEDWVITYNPFDERRFRCADKDGYYSHSGYGISAAIGPIFEADGRIHVRHFQQRGGDLIPARNAA